MKEKPKTVLAAAYGQIACCNAAGEQMGELQMNLFVLWAEHAEKLGYDVDGVRIECMGRIMVLEKAKFEGEETRWFINPTS